MHVRIKGRMNEGRKSTAMHVRIKGRMNEWIIPHTSYIF